MSKSKIENEKICLPQNRKYKTISSIPTDSKDYKTFQIEIEFEEQLFSLFSTQETTEKQEEKECLIKRIIKSIKEQKPSSQFFYFVDLLVYFLLIRPKQTEITCNLLSFFFLNNMYQSILIETIQNNKLFRNNGFINNILYSQGFINEIPEDYLKQENTVFSIYKKGSLEFILKENNVNSLKEYIQQNQNVTKDPKNSN